MGNPRLPKVVKPILVALNVRIDEALYEDLDRETRVQNRPKRAVIEQAIREYLERCREEA